jgi:hypothetical protein
MEKHFWQPCATSAYPNETSFIESLTEALPLLLVCPKYIRVVCFLQIFFSLVIPIQKTNHHRILMNHQRKNLNHQHMNIVIHQIRNNVLWKGKP